ncbi:MAG: formylglycine-generating enzyme family protein [Prosthecobacter sp.]
MSSSLHPPTHCDLERKILWEGQPHAMAFRLIPPGRFRMGSRGEYSDEEPRHWVEIKRAFWMAETPVTQAQYRFMAGQCLGELKSIEGNKGAEPSDFNGDDLRPVESVNWHEARVTAAWLQRCGALPTGQAAFLPTEAQWEYACRAGTTTEYHSGDGVAALEIGGWYSGNSGRKTHPVRQKAMNAFGLYDLHGNVWEWCADRWDPFAYVNRFKPTGKPDVKSDAHSHPVVRGGSWEDSFRYCRSAFRHMFHPTTYYWDPVGGRLGSRGFRLCLSAGPAEVGARGAPSTFPAKGGVR